MKLFSYVVRYDNGFAPNPFWGYCTLACCKPDIRLRAEEGDFILGSGSKRHSAQYKIIYGMYVDFKLPFNDYFKDHRFVKKKPRKEGTAVLGDNIYCLDKNGKYQQRDNAFHTEKHMGHDLKGKYVLIAGHKSFWYFGQNAPIIPDKFAEIIKKGPNYKYKFDPELVAGFLNWMEDKKKGVRGVPFDLPEKISINELCLQRNKS